MITEADAMSKIQIWKNFVFCLWQLAIHLSEIVDTEKFRNHKQYQTR